LKASLPERLNLQRLSAKLATATIKQKKLKALGVTSYDLDTALSQATKTIFKAKDGTDQIVLSQKAFGKAGADLIPVIKQFGGDLEAATKEAERLGETLTDKDVNASDNFGDAWALVGSGKSRGSCFHQRSNAGPDLVFHNGVEWYARNQSEVRFGALWLRDTSRAWPMI
jgi:hypothetical protein